MSVFNYISPKMHLKNMGKDSTYLDRNVWLNIVILYQTNSKQFDHKLCCFPLVSDR